MNNPSAPVTAALGPWRIAFVVVASMMLSLLALAYIELWGPGTDVRIYFFGGIRNLGELEQLLHQNYLKGLRNIMILILLYAILYLFFFVMIFEALALLFFLFSSKWCRPVVFISYKNTEEGSRSDTTKMSEEMETGLRQNGIDAKRFRYTTELHHDQVNFNILKDLRRSKVLIVLPDAYKPSYVNAEIAMAAYAAKPVFLIRHATDQRLPDTANSGHAVLTWKAVKKENFKLLAKMMRYVSNNWRSRFFILYMPLICLFYLVAFFEDDSKYTWWGLLGFGVLIAALLHFQVPLEHVLNGVKFVVCLLGAAAACVTLYYILRRVHLQKVVRQTILTGGDTYQHFEAADYGKDLLALLDRKGLQIAD